MAYDETLAARIRKALSRQKPVEERRMFGGIGFLVGGHLAVGVWKRSFVVRLGETRAREALQEPHVGKFDITRRPMKGWVLVGPEGLTEEDSVRGWVRQAVRFVRTLPPKPPAGDGDGDGDDDQ